ncbi:MAG: hypothetical protein IPG35_04725 [Flavobacteriales bacterium]|nr:hypothetical protein [Flavobacteriales bacterium]
MLSRCAYSMLVHCSCSNSPVGRVLSGALHTWPVAGATTHAVVLLSARQEGDRRLAAVQPVRAAAQEQPLAVVRAPGEGLQARHAGQGHFLQHERTVCDHLRVGGPGQGSGEQQQDQGKGGGAGIHAAKLSAARAPGR